MIPDAQVTLSSDIGRIGLLERENAAILNACLRATGARDRGRLPPQPSAELGITAPLYLTQNDGTLMSADYAEQYPVLTFASGPTNSMRGAAFLSGLKDAMVVDVGGTTSDVGALTHGFPREASVAVDIGGVRTNFRMPDVYSFGLGGGSLVTRGSAAHRAAERRLPDDRGGARLRRRDADHDRRRGGGGGGRHRRRRTRHGISTPPSSPPPWRASRRWRRARSTA